MQGSVLICFIFPFMDQEEAVKEVVEFMNAYSITQEDFDTVVELSKFQVTHFSFYLPYNIVFFFCCVSNVLFFE